MPRLTIDGTHLEVEAGSTVLSAARQAGIDIPALCTVEGLPPLTSCFVCVVQVVGQPKLLPACATVVEDGMVVVSGSPEVLSARRTAVELLLSDHLGECEAPCEISCPAGFQAPMFMEDVLAGRLDEAAARARRDLVLPGALGRICPRFCENSCRRRERDEPVSIAHLHRHVVEREIVAGQIGSSAAGPSTGKRVAIVGAGPAGLAAAFHLLARGHACTLLDSRPEPGGMLRYGLGEAYVPRAVLAGEIEVIRRMGAEFRMGCELGRDTSVARLRTEFDAVLLAPGAPVWRKLACPGAELAEDAGDLMARLASGEPADLECDVMVVGAGQEAIEVALTAGRHGATSVAVLCPRPQEHLPLLARPIKVAQAAGVVFHFGVEIREIRRPALRLYIELTVKGTPARLDCNRLFVAGTRSADIELLKGQGLEPTARGVHADRVTMATSIPGVFAAGDVVSGGGFCVRAVAQGRVAAESIDQYLAGRAAVGLARPYTVRYGKLADEERAALQARARNPGRRSAKVTDDKTAAAEAARCLVCGCQDNHLCRLRQVATRLNPDMSRFKGERRAMECDSSHPLVVYESHKCVMCGACVAIVQADRQARRSGAPSQPGEPADVASERVDGAVSAEITGPAEPGLTFIGRGFNVRVAAPWGARLADALGELAVRCAQACPTSAIVLKRRREK